MATSIAILACGCASTTNQPARPAAYASASAISVPVGLPTVWERIGGCGSPAPIVTFHMPPPHEPAHMLSSEAWSSTATARAQTATPPKPLPRAQTVPPTPKPIATPNYHPTGSPRVREATPC